MKLIALAFVLVSTTAAAQSSTQLNPPTAKSASVKAISANKIVVGRTSQQRLNSIRLSESKRSIKVSNTLLKEVETAVKTLYGIENKLVDLKVSGRKSSLLNLTSHVGAKGWEAKATGILSKKRNASFDLNYRFSIEDLFVHGMGHRLMLITKF